MRFLDATGRASRFAVPLFLSAWAYSPLGSGDTDYTANYLDSLGKGIGGLGPWPSSSGRPAGLNPSSVVVLDFEVAAIDPGPTVLGAGVARMRQSLKGWHVNGAYGVGFEDAGVAGLSSIEQMIDPANFNTLRDHVWTWAPVLYHCDSLQVPAVLYNTFTVERDIALFDVMEQIMRSLFPYRPVVALVNSACGGAPMSEALAARYVREVARHFDGALMFESVGSDATKEAAMKEMFAVATPIHDFS